MLFSFIMILFPVFILINTVSSKVGYVINHATEITSSLVDFLKSIEVRVGYHFMNAETIRNLSGMALSELPLILGATVNSMVALVVMYFLLYFMLTNCNKLEDWMEDVLPLRKDNLQRVRHQMNQMVISNAVGIPLIALLQGIAGLILYLILGIKEPLLWFALTAFTSILPLVGSCACVCSSCHYTVCERRYNQGNHYSCVWTGSYCYDGQCVSTMAAKENRKCSSADYLIRCICRSTVIWIYRTHLRSLAHFNFYITDAYLPGRIYCSGRKSG